MGFTQEELSDRAGVAVRTIRDIESGRIARPRPGTVRLLANSFGLDDADRQDLHRLALLDDDEGSPSDRADARDPVSEQTERPTPAQLPADLPGFIGRSEYLGRLSSLMEDGRSSGGGRIAVITGTAGVGKSALALHWAHQVADRFPDGQLYLNLRGFDPGGAPMRAIEAVHILLDALGVAPDSIPVDLSAQIGLYRSLLADRQVLIVLDNVRDGDDVRPLLPGSPGCLAVVTSRSQLTGLIVTEGANPVTLDLLTADEALQLLIHRLGADRIDADRPAVDAIITATARLPLALAIVAARAATHPAFALSTLAEQLRETRDALDVLSGRDAATDVRAVFFWSYRTLTPAAARLFRLLGLHTGRGISATAAASLVGAPVRRTRRLLDELAEAHLISEDTAGHRYTLHDLLGAYAAELARAIDTEANRRQAQRRLVDHYLHTSYQAAMLLAPHRHPIALAPTAAGVVPQELPDYGHAMSWLATERPALVAAIDQAAAEGLPTQAWQLAWTLSDFFHRGGHWRHWAATQRTALAAARQSGDRIGQAHAHRLLGVAYLQLGRPDEAGTHLESALGIFEELGDCDGQGFTHRGLGRVAASQSQFPEALRHLHGALEMFRGTGNESGQAGALNAIGWQHAHLGNFRAALNHCEQALALQEQLGDRHAQADTWDSLAFAHQHLGDHEEAVRCYKQSLTLARELGDRYGEAYELISLGDVYREAGDPDAARQSWEEALGILDDLRHPETGQVRSRLESLARTS